MQIEGQESSEPVAMADVGSMEKFVIMDALFCVLQFASFYAAKALGLSDQFIIGMVLCFHLTVFSWFFAVEISRSLSGGYAAFTVMLLGSVFLTGGLGFATLNSAKTITNFERISVLNFTGFVKSGQVYTMQSTLVNQSVSGIADPFRVNHMYSGFLYATRGRLSLPDGLVWVTEADSSWMESLDLALLNLRQRFPEVAIPPNVIYLTPIDNADAAKQAMFLYETAFLSCMSLVSYLLICCVKHSISD